MKIWIVLLLVLLAALQCDLWFSSGGISSVLHMKKAMDAQMERNQTLMERNHLLEIQVGELKNGQDSLEDKARNDLGMINQEEEFYQIIESESIDTSKKS